MENNTNDPIKIARVEAIKKYRIEQCDLSQAQLAKVLKVAQGRVSNMESGGTISKSLAKKLSVLMGKTLDFFFD